MGLDIIYLIPLYVAFLGISVTHRYEPLPDFLYGTMMDCADK